MRPKEGGLMSKSRKPILTVGYEVLADNDRIQIRAHDHAIEALKRWINRELKRNWYFYDRYGRVYIIKVDRMIKDRRVKTVDDVLAWMSRDGFTMLRGNLTLDEE